MHVRVEYELVYARAVGCIAERLQQLRELAEIGVSGVRLGSDDAFAGRERDIDREAVEVPVIEVFLKE